MHQLTWKIWEGYFNAWPDAWMQKLCWIFSLLLWFCLHSSSLHWRQLRAVSQLWGSLLPYPGPWWALWLLWMGSLTRPATPGRPLPPLLGLTSWKSLFLLPPPPPPPRRGFLRPPRADRERAGDDYINQCQVWELWFMNMHNELSPLRRTS